MTRSPEDASGFSEDRRAVLLTLAGTLTLAACGGGSGGTAPAQPAAIPRLKVRGSDLLGPDGKPVTLRGWNWGRWGFAQPGDAARNAGEGATCVRIPLR